MNRPAASTGIDLSIPQFLAPSQDPADRIEVPYLDAIPAAVDEEEEVSCAGGLAEALLNQAREAIEVPSQFDRSGAEERADGRRERDHRASSRGAGPARGRRDPPAPRAFGTDSPRTAARPHLGITPGGSTAPGGRCPRAAHRGPRHRRLADGPGWGQRRVAAPRR